MIYEFQCTACKHVQDVMTTLAKRDDPQACEACGKPSKRKLSVPRVFLPRWMRDENWDSARRHSKWLKSDKAKKLEMNHAEN